MILSFKPQFVDKILDGIKIHTIREDKNERWKPGRMIHFATGVRTRKYNQFTYSSCKRIQTIKFRYDNKCSDYPGIWIDGVEHRIYHIPNILLKLSFNDGFNSVKDFLRWFNKDFEGVIIHWTDFKY